MLAEPIAITLLVIEAFEKLEVPYLIGGSLASALHGTARSTLDTDLVADLKGEQAVPLVDMLKMDFYIDEEMILDAIHYQSSFNVIHLTTMFKVIFSSANIAALRRCNFSAGNFRLSQLSQSGKVT